MCDIGWPVLLKKVILTGDLFFSQIILPEIRTGSFSNEPGVLVRNKLSQNWYTLQDTQLFDRTPEGTDQL